MYFLKQLDIELIKISHPDVYEDGNKGDNIEFDKKTLAELPLSEIRKINPDYEKELRDNAFAKSKNEYGEYQCAVCGMTDKTRIPYQVDHIIPMNKGGKTVPENLQILCRRCNGTKGDR